MCGGDRHFLGCITTAGPHRTAPYGPLCLEARHVLMSTTSRHHQVCDGHGLVHCN
jgi:hypothetical protein